MDRGRPGALRSLRERSRLMVIDVLRRRGTASQADIARETGLSRTTISNLIAELRDAGLVVERVAPPPGWPGLNPKVELERRLHLKVEVDNDANLGALGELTFGAGKGARNLVYVKIASGVGAGIVLDGRIYHGASGIAGEIGHVLVAPD